MGLCVYPCSFFVCCVFSSVEHLACRSQPTNTMILSLVIKSYILGSAGTLLFDVTIVIQSFLYRGRKPLDPPLSSASGFLPPRSVGFHSSIHSISGHNSTILSHSHHGSVIRGTISSRTATLRARMGSMKRAAIHAVQTRGSESRGEAAEEGPGDVDTERAPLLRSPTSSIGSQEEESSGPRYSSTSTEDRTKG